VKTIEALPVALILILAAAGCEMQPAAARGRPAQITPLGSADAPGTSAASLDAVVRQSEEALARNPEETGAALRLADAWLRLSRVHGRAALAVRAERVLRPVLLREPDRPDGRRLLVSALFSQHRFREALAEVERAAAARPGDTWALAAMGDAWIELGDYDRGFDAYDRAAAQRPDAAAYARIAYGRELTGDTDGALRIMTLALDATNPGDAEQVAWLLVEIGRLHLQANRLTSASRWFSRADAVYPGYRAAGLGLARAAAARGDQAESLAQLSALSPGPDVSYLQARSLRALGRGADAARAEQLAEAGWRIDSPDPVRLALLLAGQPGRAAEAVAVAERASRDRTDIFIADALAWAYYRAGRHAEARQMSARALRTGIMEPEMRRRARAIASTTRGVRQ
jgi:tetratricopeptide (TPR) repeat protein